MTDFEKLLPKEIFIKGYDDVVSPAAKQIGLVGGDIGKSLRLLLVPFQFLAHKQDILAKRLTKIVDSIPEARRIPPSMSQASQIADGLLREDEASEIAPLFERLLSRCMDRERVSEAHPAFVHIIKQLSPDEAKIIQQIGINNIMPVFFQIKENFHNLYISNTNRVMLKHEILPFKFKSHPLWDNNKMRDQYEKFFDLYIDTEALVYPNLCAAYIDHLVHMNLIQVDSRTSTSLPGPGSLIREKDSSGNIISGSDVSLPPSVFRLSVFGELFFRACISE